MEDREAVVAQQLMEKAQPRANRINEILNEDDEMRALDDRPMTIAALLFAVSMAKMTGLNMKDLTSLLVYAYIHVNVERKEPDAEGEEG